MELDLRHLVDALPGLVWAALPDGRAEFLNHRWREYTGLSHEQGVGFGWHSAIHPEDRHTLLDGWRSFRESRQPGELRARLRRHDGRYRRFLFRAAPLAADSGNVVKWCGINTDIEEWLTAEEALRASEDVKASEAKLRQVHRFDQHFRTVTRSEIAHMSRVSTLGALTASIAHEVNQPLSGITINAGTCVRRLSADPPNLDGARIAAERTLRDAKRMSDVIQRLRNLFSRNRPTTESVDLNDAAREVLALSTSELRSCRVILQIELDDGVPAVRGDRVQLQQVILNLVLNAIDAMKAIDDRPRQLTVATGLEESDRVRLSVVDTGVGIDAESSEELFNAFHTTKSHGMGLGLSVSRSIIESHGGRLRAIPNDGPGATFAFSIPAA